MNLDTLSDDDLIALRNKLKDEISVKDSTQQAIKILINSLYGAVGNAGFRFFNRDMARSITLTGQSVILWSEKVANAFLNKTFKTENVDYVLAIDTDSVYLNVEPLYYKILEKYPGIDKNDLIDQIDKFCVLIQKELAKGYDEFYLMTNGYENRLDMKRENIGASVFYQKKRYFMQVYDSEGERYQTPKPKVMGLEAVRSTTPEWARKKLKETYMKTFELSKEQMIEHLYRVEQEFYSMSLDEIALPTGVSEIDKFTEGVLYRKGTPAHVKAAIHYNKMIDDLGLQDKYVKIKNGDKIKMILLREPNPTGNNVIAYLDYLPSEFGLDPYINKKAMYNKIFLDGIKRIFEVIGYDTEHKNNSDDFF